MYRKQIEIAVKNTVGYAEASNKESFMVGVSVALSHMEDVYEKEIKQLGIAVTMWETAYNNVMKDFKTLTTILSRYTDDN